MEFVNIRSLIKTVNAVNGCTAGCVYCYAKKINTRFKITPDFGVPEFQISKLSQIGKAKTANTYFMTSMSDFSDWKESWRVEVFNYIGQYPQHSYLFLTKFPERISFKSSLSQVWAGATITSPKEKRRITALRENIKVKNYFLTFEPLFGDMGELDLTDIKWIVIGTETGNRKGKITAEKDWVLNIARQAKAQGIAVFMKDGLLPIVGEANMLQELPFLNFKQTSLFEKVA